MNSFQVCYGQSEDEQLQELIKVDDNVSCSRNEDFFAELIKKEPFYDFKHELVVKVFM